MKLDSQDQAALNKLDGDIKISADGESARITGEMELTVKRPDQDAGNQFLIVLTLPGGEDFEIRIRRVQLLEQLGVGDNKND